MGMGPKVGFRERYILTVDVLLAVLGLVILVRAVLEGRGLHYAAIGAAMLLLALVRFREAWRALKGR